MTAPETPPQAGPSRRGAGSPLAKRYNGVPLWLWVVGGTAVATGVFVFIRNRRKSGTGATDATATPTGADGSTSPAYGSPISLIPVDQSGPGITSDQYNSLVTAITALQGTLSKPVTPPATGTAGGSVEAVIPGAFNFKWTQRDLARALLPEAQRSDKNAVERELGLLHKYNPTWITSGPNPTRPLGGHKFRKPVTS